ncbi:hypothetical protein [Clostridium omnivorum]|uniref:Uncharacterized protein n=1 Tax=Clostridium omnivorum TaxID=1604902 RepID=A0ABQ5N0U4_9CLOT|nr:hypothetical protein [Clostridium sp. E14]GLC28829.1 hypothetical protein bsdE14_02390 [Clostridium sp. E14]
MTNKKQREDTENRVDELINLVERKTRTERHLEQHSDIGDPDRLDRPQELQDEREEQIHNLKNKIVYGDSVNNDTNDQIENLERNYEFTEGYINHNSDHISSKDMNRIEEKQEHRREQMDILKQ